MSCINANITRASAAGNVAVSWVKKIELKVRRTPTPLTVSVGNVCTSSVADGNEMWWCTSWRVVWNDGIKTLWNNN